jgi:hypothetical protein
MLSRKYNGLDEKIQLMFLPWRLPWFPDAKRNEIFVALNTTEAEYVPLSVRSGKASQSSDKLVRYG